MTSPRTPKWYPPIVETTLLETCCRRHPRIALLAVVAFWVLAAVASGSTVRLFRILQEQRRAQLDSQATVAARVQSVVTAAPDAVPLAIENLRTAAADAVPRLRAELNRPDTTPAETLHAACALAALDDVALDAIAVPAAQVSASVGECKNVVEALRMLAHRSQAAEIAELLRRRAAPTELAADRARWATIALFYGDLAVAESVLVEATDPSPRCSLIHGFANWRGNLVSLGWLRTEGTPQLRSAVCLAMGLVDPQSLATVERRAAVELLTHLYQVAEDGGTHSAAGWALRTWQVPLPATDSTPVSDETARQRWVRSAMGLTLMRIEPGSFLMGDPDTSLSADRLQHGVTLTQAYWMSDREVSRDLFDAFLNDPEYPHSEKPRADRMTPDLRVSPTGEHPVQNVTWEEAALFCNWLSWREGRDACYWRGPAEEWTDSESSRPDESQGNQAGEVSAGVQVWRWNQSARGYRLPTEAEWEFACRAATTTLYHFGDDASLLPHYATVSNSRVIPTRPCGTLLPNAWGLFDMHGGVWEWCWDWFAPFESAPDVDPNGPNEPLEQFGQRVVRGGGVLTQSGDPDSAVRGRIEPTSSAYLNLGFRVARTAEP